MDEIEVLCTEFPEIAGMIYSMYMYTRQPAKAKEYSKKFDAYVFGRSKCRIRFKYIV